MDLRNCDCMDLMGDFSDNHFDLAIVDPPYFDGPNKLGYYGKGFSSIGVRREHYDKLGNWSLPDDEYFNELLRVSKNQIVWGVNYYPIQNLGPGRIIWNKHNKSSSFSDAEIAYCSIGSRVDIFDFMWNGMLQGKSMFEGHIAQGNKKLNEKRIHPTQKPVELYKWLLHNYSKPGSRILDTHLGSGSIAIACNSMGFELTGSEIDKTYFDAILNRIKIETAQQDIFK